MTHATKKFIKWVGKCLWSETFLYKRVKEADSEEVTFE